MSQHDDMARTTDALEAARERLKQRLIPEVQTALMAAPEVRAWPPDWQSRGEIDYFYRSSWQAQAVEACASTSSVNSSEGFFQL